MNWDVGDFTTNTIDFLNLVMLVHAKDVNAGTALMLAQYSPLPHVEEQLFDDLHSKRNRHLLDEIQARLPQSGNLIVPWELPTCRAWRRKFKSLVSVWAIPRNMW